MEPNGPMQEPPQEKRLQTDWCGLASSVIKMMSANIILTGFRIISDLTYMIKLYRRHLRKIWSSPLNPAFIFRMTALAIKNGGESVCGSKMTHASRKMDMNFFLHLPRVPLMK